MKMSFYSNIDDARICETSRTTNAQMLLFLQIR